MTLKSQSVRTALLGALISMIFYGAGCGDDDPSADSGGPDDDGGHEESPPEDGGTGRDGSEPDPEPMDASEPMPDGAGPDAAEEDSGTDSGTPEEDAEVPLTLGGLTVTTSVEELEGSLDIFGKAGNRFWMEVSPEQLQRLNSGGCCGGGFPFPGGGDIYTPGGASSDATYADHVLVQDVETEEVADYGKVEISLVGQSTHREWTEHSIPNVRVDTNEFEKDTRIGTFEHFRFNNSLVGTIFREHIVHEIYRALGYPALRSTYAFLGSNVWGDDIWVPMTFIEMYKRRFCEDNQELLGGDCDKMWEFAGDIGQSGGWGYPYEDIRPPGGPIPNGPDGGVGADTSVVPEEWCQVSECDNTRLAELMTVLAGTTYGAGFKAALADYIDWDRFHQFQCLSWIMVTTDDPIHAGNNNVIIERDDGKFVWAPYSVDISTGFGGYSINLTGTYSLAYGCQRDQECWSDMIAVCEDVVARFDDLNPEQMVDDTVTLLNEHDMMRYNDEQYASEVRAFFVQRQETLADELERFRFLPDEHGNCPDELELCGDGGCGTPEACQTRQCRDGAWCEARQQCVYSMYECPECTVTSPYYCEIARSCVADESVCREICSSNEEYQWCDAYSACWYVGDYCPDGQGDGGVPTGGFGGMGGIGGGFPIPID